MTRPWGGGPVQTLALPEEPFMPLLSNLAQALEEGGRSRVVVLTAPARQENVSPDGIVKEGCLPG